MTPYEFKEDPDRDLLLERDIDVPADFVWKAWTEPELIKKWFTPKPWSTPEAMVDLRPGGDFTVVMQSPEGERNVLPGCYLEVDPNRRLVWTNTFSAGYRPLDSTPEFAFTAVITLTPTATGTNYSVLAIHPDPKVAARHAEQGFHEGWGLALDQLVELAHSR